MKGKVEGEGLAEHELFFLGFILSQLSPVFSSANFQWTATHGRVASPNSCS